MEKKSNKANQSKESTEKIKEAKTDDKTEVQNEVIDPWRRLLFGSPRIQQKQDEKAEEKEKSISPNPKNEDKNEPPKGFSWL